MLNLSRIYYRAHRRVHWTVSLRGILTGLMVFSMLSGVGTAAEIIGHRGASSDAPENSLPSTHLAWKQGANAVEIDVRLSKDGQIVLMHDNTAKRTAGVDRPIVEMTWDEIQLLDIGAWKGPKFEQTRVPLLSDVLETIPENGRLFIEIKCGPEIVPELKRILTSSGRSPEKTVIICFDQKVIKRTVHDLPAIQSYLLVSLRRGKKKAPVPVENIIAAVKKTGAHGADLGSDTQLINESFMSQLNQAGIPCYVWTVNQPEEARRLAELGVLGITTDKPKLMKAKGIASIQ